MWAWLLMITMLAGLGSSSQLRSPSGGIGVSSEEGTIFQNYLNQLQSSTRNLAQYEADYRKKQAFALITEEKHKNHLRSTKRATRGATADATTSSVTGVATSDATSAAAGGAFSNAAGSTGGSMGSIDGTNSALDRVKIPSTPNVKEISKPVRTTSGLIIDGATHWQLRSSLVNARQMMAFQQDRNSELQAKATRQCQESRKTLEVEYKIIRQRIEISKENKMKTERELVSLTSLVGEAENELERAKTEREGARVNHTRWLNQAEKELVRTKSAFRAQINSLQSLSTVVEKLELPARTLTYLAESRSVVTAAAVNGTTQHLAVLALPSVKELTTEWNINERKAKGVRLVIRIQKNLRRTLKLLRGEMETMEREILEKRRNFELLLEELSEETMAKRTYVATMARQLNLTHTSAEHSLLVLQGGQEKKKLLINELKKIQLQCHENESKHDRLRFKLLKQQDEIDQLDALMKHQSADIMVAAPVKNVAIHKTTIKKTVVVAGLPLHVQERHKNVDITPRNIERVHGSIMSTEKEREERERQVNEEHYKQQHRGDLNFEPVQEAPLEERDVVKKGKKEEMKPIVFTECFYGIDGTDWESNEKDNNFVLQNFLVKWIGIDASHVLLATSPSTAACTPPPAPATASQADASSLLETQKMFRGSSREETIKSVAIVVTMEVPENQRATIQKDMNVVKTMVDHDDAADINAAMSSMIREFGAKSFSAVLGVVEKLEAATGAAETGAAATGAAETGAAATGAAETGAADTRSETGVAQTGASGGQLMGATGATGATGAEVGATGATGSSTGMETGLPTEMTGFSTGETGIGATAGPEPLCVCPAWLHSDSLMSLSQESGWSGPACETVACEMATTCGRKDSGQLSCLIKLCSKVAKTLGTDENKFCLQVETAVAGAGISTKTAPGMKKGSALLDVGDEGGNWTTLSTNFKPTQEERQAKQDTQTKEMVDNLVHYMNVHGGDTKTSVEAPVGEVEEDVEDNSFMEIGAQNWTTYSTSFKPAKEERQAKQDTKTKEMVDNLVHYMNVHGGDTKTSVEASVGEVEEDVEDNSFMEVGAENSTTYSTNFKPTQEERQAKQDDVTKQDVQNLVILMNHSKKGSLRA